MIGSDSPNESELMLVQSIVSEMPIRSFISMSAGKVGEGVVGRIIHAMNNDWLKVISGGEVRSE